jgi:hypothetical protein
VGVGFGRHPVITVILNLIQDLAPTEVTAHAWLGSHMRDNPPHAQIFDYQYQLRSKTTG